MSQDLISKKDLLELTGISYGQLYRWKRKNLIPEDWFVRKSTFTGQETFFPKDRILERIEKIQTMKENVSLDDLANMFSPSVDNQSLDGAALLKKEVASPSVLQFFYENSMSPKDQPLSFDEMLYVFILETMLQSGTVQLEEAKMVLEVLQTHYPTIKQKNNNTFLFLRKLGVSSCLLVSNAEELIFDPGTKVIMKLSIMKVIEELNTRLL